MKCLNPDCGGELYPMCEKCERFPEWISVKDRLPKDGEDVLVYHAADLHITVGYFESANVQYYLESDGSRFYTDSGWETEIPWAQKGGVTHWCELPNAPKDE